MLCWRGTVCPDGIVFHKKAGKLLNLENEARNTPPDPRLASVTPMGNPRWTPDNNVHPRLSTTARPPSYPTVLLKTLQNCAPELLAEGVESYLRPTPR